MLDQVERVFHLRPDVDLDLMRHGQTPNELASRALAALDRVLVERRPDWLLVQGDTTTAMAGALAAFHRGVRVGHVEAGLRTGDLTAPFPEEANRRIADLLAALCFAPTEGARRLLLAEGVAPERIHVTGNTVIDALELAAARLPEMDAEPEGAPGGEVLVTLHRRESFGGPLAEIATALADLARAFPKVRWVFPVHPNPNVRAAVQRILGGSPNVELHEPFDYLELVRRLRRSRLVVTDSGGLQEESPTFGCPVVVVRERTDRPEAVAAGLAVLAGSSRLRIVAAVTRLLTDPAAHRRLPGGANPYGDGRAAERIAAALAGESFAPFRAAEAVPA
jgi:UDP-N-acetylglucosamine 2-epimerase (non-hydrolysing)